MEQELIFGLDLGRLTLLKKREIWADYKQLLRLVFSCFHEQKRILKNILDGENIFGIE